MELSVLVKKYEKYLPVTRNSPHLTLGEGDTPLIRVERLEGLFDELLSFHLGRVIKRNLKIYAKREDENHSTGSFKDRGMIIAIINALEEGCRAIAAATTGNTGASAAAYASAAGLPALVVVPEAVAVGKLSQMMMYGAKILTVDGNFDAAFRKANELVEKYPGIKLVNSTNEYRIEGQKTAAFEICDTLGYSPDYVFLPVGNAGNITAYWKGFKEYYADGKIKKLPKMMGYQADGAAPIVEGHIIETPETDATAIRIGNPASWKRAEEARDESNGLIDKVTDQELYRAQYFLSAESRRAIYVELASAAGVAGMFKYNLQNHFPDNSTIVFVVTGTGIKNPEAAQKNPFKKEIVNLSRVTNQDEIIRNIIGR